MKIFPIIILVYNFLYIQNNCELGLEKVDDPKNCTQRKFSDTEKNLKKHCCYFKYTILGKQFKDCNALTEEEYQNVKEISKNYTKTGVYISTIDCKSSYLQIELLSLIFIIFWLYF